MERRFVTNADVHKYIGKNPEEFLQKFNTTDEIFARAGALIEQENDSRLKDKAKHDINRIKLETKHSDIFNERNTTKQYIKEEVKEISKKIFNVLTASSNNKYVIENIIENFEAKIKPLRGDGDKEFEEANIQEYDDIRKEVTDCLLTLGIDDDIQKSLQQYKTKWTTTLSKTFSTANPKTIGAKISKFINEIIKENIREYIEQTHEETSKDIYEFIQTIVGAVPTEIDKNQLTVDYIEKYTDQDDSQRLLVNYIDNKIIEMHEKSVKTSLPLIKLSLLMIIAGALQSPLNVENSAIKKEVIMKQLETFSI